MRTYRFVTSDGSFGRQIESPLSKDGRLSRLFYFFVIFLLAFGFPLISQHERLVRAFVQADDAVRSAADDIIAAGTHGQRPRFTAMRLKQTLLVV